jgi:hypothetical protein
MSPDAARTRHPGGNAVDDVVRLPSGLSLCRISRPLHARQDTPETSRIGVIERWPDLSDSSISRGSLPRRDLMARVKSAHWVMSARGSRAPGEDLRSTAAARHRARYRRTRLDGHRGVLRPACFQRGAGAPRLHPPQVGQRPTNWTSAPASDFDHFAFLGVSTSVSGKQETTPQPSQRKCG